MKKIKISTLILSLFLVLLTGYFAFALTPKSYLKISFLDVGQGDSILFETPKNGRILIDGGRDNTVSERLGEELPLFSKNIELVIGTHDDSDHITGLIDVVQKYNVKVLLYSLPNSKSELSKELLRVCSERNVKVVQVDRPMIIKTEDGLFIKILFPVKKMDGSASNNASIVTQFIFGKNRFMLTGDLPIEGEMYLVNKYGEGLKSDLLKFGHHGSDTSTSPEFLQNVKPQLGIVSAGKNNSFGHPHKSVMDLADKFGIKVLQTSEQGTIHIYSDGMSIWQE